MRNGTSTIVAISECSSHFYENGDGSPGFVTPDLRTKFVPNGRFTGGWNLMHRVMTTSLLPGVEPHALDSDSKRSRDFRDACRVACVKSLQPAHVALPAYG